MKEAQLAEVLTAANLDPGTLAAINQRLEEVLDNKNQVRGGRKEGRKGGREGGRGGGREGGREGGAEGGREGLIAVSLKNGEDGHPTIPPHGFGFRLWVSVIYIESLDSGGCN